MTIVSTRLASVAGPPQVAPLFDAYRQFDAQMADLADLADLAATDAFLRDRSRKGESVHPHCR